jgi:hypothetical protein
MQSVYSEYCPATTQAGGPERSGSVLDRPAWRTCHGGNLSGQHDARSVGRGVRRGIQARGRRRHFDRDRQYPVPILVAGFIGAETLQIVGARLREDDRTGISLEKAAQAVSNDAGAAGGSVEVMMTVALETNTPPD